MSRDEKCIRCEHFSFKDAQPQEYGLERCKGFDTPNQYEPTIPQFVRWDARPCVIFGMAKDMGPRTAWINKEMSK